MSTSVQCLSLKFDRVEGPLRRIFCFLLQVSQDTRVSVNPSSWRVEISHAISADSGVWRCVADGDRSPPLNLVVTSEFEPKIKILNLIGKLFNWNIEPDFFKFSPSNLFPKLFGKSFFLIQQRKRKEYSVVAPSVSW